MASAVVMTKPRLCAIDTITIDIVTDESHALNNQITDHPIESGSSVSDHVRPEADLVTLHCFVANQPLSTGSRSVTQDNVTFTTSAPNTGDTINGLKVGDPGTGDRSKQAFDQLKKIRDQGTLIKVVTTLKTYPENNSPNEGMVIQSLNISRTSKNYDGLEFTAVLKQIRIVKNRQTTDTQPKEPQVSQKKHQGAKTTQEETPESTAHKLKDGATKLVGGWFK